MGISETLASDIQVAGRFRDGFGTACSVGLAALGYPELLIDGLDPSTCDELIWIYRERLRQGEVFVSGGQYEGFLSGVPVVLQEADPELLARAPGGGGATLQLVWPDSYGRWPWDPAADAAYRRLQQSFYRVLNG